MMHLEEKLLNEISHSGRCGVDLEDPAITSTKNGFAPRASIGLPEISEPQALRHFVRLSQQNFSIDTNFYPLGSCTMKHNPRQNERLSRFPQFLNLHPLQPTSTTQGALRLMWDLQNWLTEMTGLPAVTLTPGAGAHGELAGMMVIHQAHKMRGRQRKIVLVPDSAHGTNPATAVMCGYTTKTIPSTAEGIVDVDALKAELNEDVAAFMLTNPNTCGLFDPNVNEISRLLKEVGAYFYCDGANFNAIAGRIRPADFGVDVMHINLHKTFSTPHGGGGPGSGPIVVSAELAPYLPIPKIVKIGEKFDLVTEDAQSIGRIKGFHGNFGMFTRALSYMLAHGGDGVRQASEDAVLAANYIKASLKDLYRSPFDAHCMHECLLNDRHQRDAGITTMDIAKTLIEHGIHPMTVFFPLVVNNAMLIEPTESETKETLDEFIAVMRSIAERVKNGDVESMKSAPNNTPRRRIDEVKAAKEQILTWFDLEKQADAKAKEQEAA
jgi:glycine dehydrogenase subunit 2